MAWLAVDTGDVPADRLRHFTATAAFSGTTDQVQVENLQGEVDLTAYQGAAGRSALRASVPPSVCLCR